LLVKNRHEGSTLTRHLDRLKKANNAALVNDCLSGLNHAPKSIPQESQRKCKRLRINQYPRVARSGNLRCSWPIDSISESRRENPLET
jgi:hypothetical protein